MRYGIGGASRWLLGMVAALSACTGTATSLQLSVAFPGQFQVQAIPPATAEIRLLVSGAADYRHQATLTPARPHLVLNGIPTGTATVAAVALDGEGTPLAGARTSAEVQPGAQAQAQLDLQPGAVDEALLALIGVPAPVPSPSANPVIEPTPVPGGDGQVPAAPKQDGSPAEDEPPATLPVPSGGGGGGSTPAPTPTPPGGGATLVPGAPYSGPITFQ